MSPGSELAPFLAYHCPKLRSDHLRPPCEGNLVRVTALREKFPQALLGPMEHCLACRGEGLVVREKPFSHYDPETRLNVELIKGIVSPHCPENAGVISHDNPPRQTEEPMTKQSCEYTGDIRPAEVTNAPTFTVPRCPKHPQEPQVACSSTSKRAGQFMGACKICIAERRLNWKPAAAKMTPAVARDLGLKAAPPPSASKGDNTAGVVKFKDAAEAVRVLGKDKLPELGQDEPEGRPLYAAGPKPSCNNHPDRPAKIDRLGRSMALCDECLSIRGRKAGIDNHKRGLTSPPVSIPLNQAKYAELRTWLDIQAEENERSLQNEIMFRLKLAMREAS